MRASAEVTLWPLPQMTSIANHQDTSFPQTIARQNLRCNKIKKKKKKFACPESIGVGEKEEHGRNYSYAACLWKIGVNNSLVKLQLEYCVQF